MPILIEEGTTNLIKNASFETGNTNGWAVNGSVTVQSTEKHFGSYAIQINDTSSSASVSISQTVSATAGATYTLSAYCKIVSGIQYMSLEFLDASGNVLAPYVIPFTETEWTRKAVTGTAPTNATQLRVRLYSTTANISNGYWDDIQVEAKAYATSVVYANDSSTQATRSPESLTIPTAGVLNPQEGTIEVSINPFILRDNMYIGIGGTRYISANEDSNSYNVWHTNKLNVAWGYGSGFYYFATSPLPLNTWSSIAITWKANDKLKLFINGTLIQSMTIGALNPVFPHPYIYVGCNSGGSVQADALFDDLRISSRARTDEEIAVAYASGQPLPVDEWTTAKLDFDGVLGLYEANVSNPSYGTDTINSLVKTVFYVDTNNVLRPLGTIVLRDSREELLPRTRDYTETVPGRDGEWDFGSEFEPRLLEFHCAVEINPEERTAFKRQLAKYLSPKNGPQPLVFGDDLGKVYYVKYSGQIDLTQYPEWLDFTIPFKMSDPYIKSTTTKTHVGDGIIINDGNVECPIVITILGPTSTAVTITIGSESITYNAAIPSGQTLIIDTEKLTAKVNNINVLGYISGTFVKLPVGESNVTITGTSAQSVTINYTERWI